MPEEDKKTLIYIIAAVVVVMAVVLLVEAFVRQKVPPLPRLSVPSPEIKINLDVLKNPSLKNFSLFEQISSTVKPYRDNPFVPY